MGFKPFLLLISLVFCSRHVEGSVGDVDESLFNTLEKLRVLAEFKKSAVNATGCSCIKYNCGCCVDLDVPEIDLNDTACVNITYLPSPVYGITVTFSLDGVVYFNETLSARNPPPLCFGIPGLTKMAGICLTFSNVSFSNYSFSACLKLDVNFLGVTIVSVNFGCFKIPPNQEAADPTLRFITARKHNAGGSGRPMHFFRKLGLKQRNFSANG